MVKHIGAPFATRAVQHPPARISCAPAPRMSPPSTHGERQGQSGRPYKESDLAMASAPNGLCTTSRSEQTWAQRSPRRKHFLCARSTSRLSAPLHQGPRAIALKRPALRYGWRNQWWSLGRHNARRHKPQGEPQQASSEAAAHDPLQQEPRPQRQDETSVAKSARNSSSTPRPPATA